MPNCDQALLEEFNTLAILYGKTSENFIAPEYQVHWKKMPVEHPLAPGDTSTIPHSTHDAVGGEQQAGLLLRRHRLPSAVGCHGLVGLWR